MNYDHSKYNKIYHKLENKFKDDSKPYYDVIKKYDEERQLYLDGSKKLHIFILIKRYQFVFYFLIICIAEIILPQIWLIIFYLWIFFLMNRIIEKAIPKIEHQIFIYAGERWRKIESSKEYALKTILKLEQKMEKDYYNICTNMNDRPPDWEIRKTKVLERDSYTCTECGWPKGYKRKARELHVHHIVPIYKGGNNDLSNLTTLCNVCHKKVDNKHKLVRNSKRKPKKNN